MEICYPLPRSLHSVLVALDGGLVPLRCDPFEELFAKHYLRLGAIDPSWGMEWGYISCNPVDDGTTCFDAMSRWFMLLLMYHPDWGLNGQLKSPASVAVAEQTTELLRRWFAGDLAGRDDWRQLLADSERLQPQGNLPDAEYAVTLIAAVYAETTGADTEFIDAVARALGRHAFPPAATAKMSTAVSVIDYLGYPITGIRALVDRLRGRPRRRWGKTNAYQALAWEFMDLMRLRWNPRDVEEASLFIAAMNGGQGARSSYAELLRKNYVEPGEIQANLRALEKLHAVARQAGIVFDDPNYVPGMSPQRLYFPNDPGQVVPIAMNVFSNFLNSEAKGWVGIEDCRTCDKEFPDRSQTVAEYDRAVDNFRAQGHYEHELSRSRRAFVKPAESPTEYWTIESDSDHIFYRSGPFPLPTDIWHSPRSQRRQIRRFGSRHAAWLAYRDAIREKRGAGFVESLPRADYFQMAAEPTAVSDAGEIVFDSYIAPDSPGARWTARHSRPAWRPIVNDIADVNALSHYRGRPWLAADEPEPACKACGTRLTCLVQIDLASLPEELQGHFGQEGLLQVLLCPNDAKCPAKPDQPFGESQLVRIMRPQGAARSEAGSKSPAEPERFITGWMRETDYPPLQLYPELEFDEEYSVSDVDGWRFADAVHAQFPVLDGDKLAGWPNFVSYPLAFCPDCDEQLQPVLQLAPLGHSSFSIWDTVRGWVLQCPAHLDQLTFYTQTVEESG